MTDAKTVAELAAKGTQGTWVYHTGTALHGRYHTVLDADESFIICEAYDDEADNKANAQRIANVPAMEVLIAEQNEQLEKQTYSYYGKDGKPVLARDLEDQRDALEAENARLREALAQPVTPQEAWQDISTAPKDESIIIYHPKAGSCEGLYESKTGRWYILDGTNLKEYSHYYSDFMEDLPCLTYLLTPPSHWQPLPEPPQSGEGK